MKKARKILSLVLAALIVFTCIPFSVTAEEEVTYKVGDIIEYGSYPQSCVTDEALIAELDGVAKEWQSLNYYSGTDTFCDGNMVPGDFAKYTDFEYSAEKYRAILFTEYRPFMTDYKTSTNRDSKNDYNINTVYYFKYEPIQWRILNPDTGLVMCESIIDSQPYNNIIYEGIKPGTDVSQCYIDKDFTAYANDYAASSIRQWLNDDFYSASFDSSQKTNIKISTLNNDAYQGNYSDYDSIQTEDKIFLLSSKEAQTSVNELNLKTDFYEAATDYAKCQGLGETFETTASGQYRGYSWLLRTAGNGSEFACKISPGGNFSSGTIVSSTHVGIRPACTMATLISEAEPSDETTNAVGDIIEYGSYPQSRVTDEALIAELDGVAKEWQSLNYYSGTGSHDGKMTPSDYMKYADIEYNDARYRAIHFTKYRPYLTREAASTSTTYTFQHNNGYYINTTYYFKFEPLKWRVLDPDTGLIMCENIIDSQAYQNTVYQGSGEHYLDSTQSVYTNDYAQSSIRKWLNNDFYNTAFSSSQKANIRITTVKNDCTINSEYNSAPINDKIFLLSYDESKTSAYGFNSGASYYDPVRKALGTDYAKCQGLWIYRSSDSGYEGTSCWWLRSPGYSSIYALAVDEYGHSYDHFGDGVNDTDRGVRPVCRLTELKYATVVSHTTSDKTTYVSGDIIEYGNYPQSRVTDEALIAELDGTTKDWQSLNYYSGTGEIGDGKMAPSDYMKYADIEYNGAKYRAIHFTKYRPIYTGYAADTSPENSNQDDNGYYINTIYYFKFEPLKWRVFDPETGLILCNSAIESQPYQNTVYSDDANYYYQDSTQRTPATNYAESSIRQWLNNDFYNTAFNDTQRSNIESTEIKYSDSSDKIFLFSYRETKLIDLDMVKYLSGTPTGGFKNLSTDYALCQGSSKNNVLFYKSTPWWLREADYCAMDTEFEYNASSTNFGVRPACRLTTIKSDTESPEVKPVEKNYTWEYDGSGHLYINGTGAINAAPDYGWEKYADEITYIEVSDGITSLPENIFSNIRYLTEVYFGSDVAEISTGAFSDCPLLTVATFNGNTAISSGAFANANQNLTFILNGNTEAPKAFAEQNGIKTVAANYDEEKKMLNFIGDITVFDYTKYNALHNILYQFADSEYLYFTKLIFADADPNINIEDDALDAENTPNGLILNNVYISLILLKDGTEQGVSFARMLELLESGEYDAFKYKLESDEKEEEGTLFQKIESFIKRALQFISKLINFIKRLFKRF